MKITWTAVLRVLVFALGIALCVAGFVVCVVLGYVNTFLQWVAGIGRVYRFHPQILTKS